MDHVHYCDGYSYGPDSFGSTDSTSGEWSPSTPLMYHTAIMFLFKIC